MHKFGLVLPTEALSWVLRFLSGQPVPTDWTCLLDLEKTASHGPIHAFVVGKVGDWAFSEPQQDAVTGCFCCSGLIKKTKKKEQEQEQEKKKKLG